MNTDTMRMIPSPLLTHLVAMATYHATTPWQRSILYQAEACPVLHPHHTATGVYWTTDGQEATREDCAGMEACVTCVAPTPSSEAAEDVASRMYELMVATYMQLDNTQTELENPLAESSKECLADLVEALKKVMK